MLRRWFSIATVVLGAVAASALSAFAQAQTEPIRIGFLTVRTGPLAAGGRQMEEGIQIFLKERNNTLAGRPVELHTGDSAGAPAVARTKMQELVERDNISCLIGPLATAEALAIDDYIRDKQIPTLSVAAAGSHGRTRLSNRGPTTERHRPARQVLHSAHGVDRRPRACSRRGDPL